MKLLDLPVTLDDYIEACQFGNFDFFREYPRPFKKLAKSNLELFVPLFTKICFELNNKPQIQKFLEETLMKLNLQSRNYFQFYQLAVLGKANSEEFKQCLDRLMAPNGGMSLMNRHHCLIFAPLIEAAFTGKGLNPIIKLIENVDPLHSISKTIFKTDELINSFQMLIMKCASKYKRLDILEYFMDLELPLRKDSGGQDVSIKVNTIDFLEYYFDVLHQAPLYDYSAKLSVLVAEKLKLKNNKGEVNFPVTREMISHLYFECFGIIQEGCNPQNGLLMLIDCIQDTSQKEQIIMDTIKAFLKKNTVYRYDEYPTNLRLLNELYNKLGHAFYLHYDELLTLVSTSNTFGVIDHFFKYAIKAKEFKVEELSIRYFLEQIINHSNYAFIYKLQERNYLRPHHYDFIWNTLVNTVNGIFVQSRAWMSAGKLSNVLEVLISLHRNDPNRYSLLNLVEMVASKDNIHIYVFKVGFYFEKIIELALMSEDVQVLKCINLNSQTISRNIFGSQNASLNKRLDFIINIKKTYTSQVDKIISILADNRNVLELKKDSSLLPLSHSSLPLDVLSHTNLIQKKGLPQEVSEKILSRLLDEPIEEIYNIVKFNRENVNKSLSTKLVQSESNNQINLINPVNLLKRTRGASEKESGVIQSLLNKTNNTSPKILKNTESSKDDSQVQEPVFKRQKFRK